MQACEMQTHRMQLVVLRPLVPNSVPESLFPGPCFFYRSTST